MSESRVAKHCLTFKINVLAYDPYKPTSFSAIDIQDVYDSKKPTWPINDVDYETAKTYTDTKKPDTKPAGMFDF